MSKNNNILVDEKGVISLNVKNIENEPRSDGEYDEDDLANFQRFLISSSNNLKLEVKYPSLDNLLSNPAAKRNYMKKIKLNVKPVKKSSTDDTSLCQMMLGIYPNLAIDSLTNEKKVIIQGFLPNKFTVKHIGQLRIGDMIISINDIPVNSKNIEQLLSLIKRPQIIQVIALAPMTYFNLNTTEILSSPLISKNHEVLSSKMNMNENLCKKIVSNSKSTHVVQGDRVKVPTENLGEDYFYFVMLLSIDKQDTGKEQQDEMVNFLRL